MKAFSSAERAYLTGQRLARLATVAPDGVVQNNPVTFFLHADDTIDIGGRPMGNTKKFRNVLGGSRVSLVVDDLAPRWWLESANDRDQGHCSGALRCGAA